MHDHVDGLGKDACRRGGDGDAPWPFLGSGDFADVAAGFRRVVVDGADDFKLMFLPHQAEDGSADGADAELHDANLLTHRAVLQQEMSV